MIATPQQVALPQVAPPQSITPSPGVLLQGISWDTYHALVQELESQPGKRLTYDNGLLEIFMPLPIHEKNKKYLARLVEIITMTLGIEICSLGSCTWNRRDLAKGLEPDECYYIQNEAIIRGKSTIDLTLDPPPDLAIEIDMGARHPLIREKQREFSSISEKAYWIKKRIGEGPR
jgi:Uma2 family endonuclease